MLFDFEADSELDQLEWNCHTLQALSDKHSTHGLRSLKVELYPADFPGVAPILKKNDWSGYKDLRFDIYNPQESSLPIRVRVDDGKRSPAYEERYNEGFILHPGMNRMSIPLTTLITSGSGRRLNLKRICRFMIFVPHPRERLVLYLDYIRLSSEG